ncbi:uncharacterized protein DC041_0003331 [Schistosoma bovis]|uniref:Uncharacterized protein n=1 Tax=Schistosoma bovis TaxID=6184 RepID=A0A430QTE2_SCHBO|nr:uncharacterized protein DC041_0003331 [Schistosoma bovis]
MALSAVRFLRLPVYLSNTYWPGLMFIRTYLLMIRRSRVNKQFAEKLIEEVLPIACKENKSVATVVVVHLGILKYTSTW